MEVTLSLSRSAVFNEVARSSSYTGAKMPDDADAYDRIPTVDEDEDELCRFWDESRAEACRAFIRMLVSEGMCSDGDTNTLRTYRDVTTRNVEQFEVIKDNEQNN